MRINRKGQANESAPVIAENAQCRAGIPPSGILAETTVFRSAILNPENTRA